MKYLIAILGFVLGSPWAFASTRMFIAKDGPKATILIIGSPSDHEALRFYDALTVAPQEMSGKWTKVFQFDNAAGERVLSAVCAFSKLLKENGTCTITIYPVNGVVIDGDGRMAEYNSPDATEAARLSDGFTAPDAAGLIYTSDDGRFIVNSKIVDGVPQTMSIFYK